MRPLGTTQFDQCVLNMALIHLCNQSSRVGQEMRRHYTAWKDETDEPTRNPWWEPHQFTIYVPHPEQQYEELTLEAGLTQGYNIEVKPILDRSQIPYAIPGMGHFVLVLKQKGLDEDFALAAIGIFARPLAVLSLDVIVDIDKPEYHSFLIKHPVLRDYPSGWEQTFRQWIQQEIRGEDLPDLVGHVDQASNRDYRSPSWSEVFLAAKGFAGV